MVLQPPSPSADFINDMEQDCDYMLDEFDSAMGESTEPVAELIFDWDDTLIDNWHAIHVALNLTMDEMGQDRWSFEKTKSNVRRSMRDSFPVLFGNRWEEAADIFLSAIQSNHLETITVLEGVPDMLASLRSAGICLAVVSNKDGQLLREEAGFLGWTQNFSAIIGATDAERDKPDPAPIYLSLSESGFTTGEDIWYVGDAPSDMECAHRAGVLPVQMVTKLADPLQFRNFPPRISLNNAAELQNFISLL